MLKVFRSVENFNWRILNVFEFVVSVNIYGNFVYRVELELADNGIVVSFHSIVYWASLNDSETAA